MTTKTPSVQSQLGEINYGTSQKGKPSGNLSAYVSRKGVAAPAVQLATTPGLHVRERLGVHKLA